MDLVGAFLYYGAWLLVFILILGGGALMGIKLSGRKIRCVVWPLDHPYVPMTRRTAQTLGVANERPTTDWGFFECAECGHPSLRKLAGAKGSPVEAPRVGRSDPDLGHDLDPGSDVRTGLLSMEEETREWS